MNPVWAGFLGGVAAMCLFILTAALYEAIKGSRDGDVYGRHAGGYRGGSGPMGQPSPMPCEQRKLS